MEEWDRRQQSLKEEEEFFDYYDTVDYYGEDDEEVDKWGRSLRTRVHPQPGITERGYAYYRVPPGEYVVTLSVGNEVLTRKALVLKDHWYDK